MAATNTGGIRMDTQQEGQPQDPEQAPEQAPEQTPEQDNDNPFSLQVMEAANNLSPDEIVPPDKVGRVLGVLLHAQDNNGDLPKPLHERFPDHYPNPND